MSNARLTLLFLGALLVALILAAPPPVALAAAGLDGGRLTARAATGTVWNGRLEKAALGRLALGDVRLAVKPAPLLLGRLAVGVSARGGPVTGAGRIVHHRGATGVEALSAVAPLSLLGAPAPLSGSVRLKGVGYLFSKGRCQRAVGEVTAEVRGLGEGATTLAGRLSCRDGALVLPLAGDRDGAGLAMLVQIDARGRYRTEARVSTGDPAVGEMLIATGFKRDASGYAVFSEGNLQ